MLPEEVIEGLIVNRGVAKTTSNYSTSNYFDQQKDNDTKETPNNNIQFHLSNDQILLENWKTNLRPVHLTLHEVLEGEKWLLSLFLAWEWVGIDADEVVEEEGEDTDRGENDKLNGSSSSTSSNLGSCGTSTCAHVSSRSTISSSKQQSHVVKLFEMNLRKAVLELADI